MSFGKIYGKAGNPRTISVLVPAKENNLEVELVEVAPHSAQIKKVNPLGKIPAFEGANGFNLTECIAIAVYLASQNEKTTLLGKTKQDYASILKWMSWANSEAIASLAAWIRPLTGAAPYNKKGVEDAKMNTISLFDLLEKHLTANQFLVGERLSLADYFVASTLTFGFSSVLDEAWRNANPAIFRWFETVSNQRAFKETYEVVYCEDALQNVPPKKEEKKKEEKKKPAPKPAAAPAPAPAEAPKPKHPLEALGKPTLILDDWKRKYSNEDTRTVALPWFWEQYKPEEYSLWKVDYKYNDELKLTFMSNNLIGGFFARLEASRKYLFGAASVYGVNNDSIIQGAFLARGQEAAPAFDVAPDWESYQFTKLDPNSEDDKKFIADMWAQDVPITVDGKTYELADGRVFK